jgi:hypothetical protein
MANKLLYHKEEVHKAVSTSNNVTVSKAADKSVLIFS